MRYAKKKMIRGKSTPNYEHGATRNTGPTTAANVDATGTSNPDPTSMSLHDRAAAAASSMRLDYWGEDTMRHSGNLDLGERT
jgi:hypothetical protein